MDRSLLDKTQIQHLDLAGNAFNIECITDTDALIDSISDEEFGYDEHLPYWTEIWPCAKALAEFILKTPELVKGRSCIELGCGLGLTGLAALRAGGDVLFTDYDQDALDFVQRNARHNGLSKVKTHRLDWRTPDIDEQFDVLIAADVLYERRFLQPMMNTILKLRKDRGFVLLAEPDRTIARPFFELLPAHQLKTRSWRINLDYFGESKHVSIYLIHANED